MSVIAALAGPARLLGWLAWAVAAAASLLFVFWRLRLREHLLPGTSRFEARRLWEKDDLYTVQGRTLLARCGFALEVGLVSGFLGALLLLLF